jgi:small conductance mechanosensitive channel
MENVSTQLAYYFSTYGLQVLGAIIILILGRIAGGIGRRIVRKLLEKSNVDVAVVNFVGSLTYFLILAFAVLAALAKFGIQTASFVAVLGAAGLAIGFALQGSLANFAAGVMILVLRPFKVGDYIMAAGEAGSVKEIQLFTTVLTTPDNIKIMIPNGKLFSDTIKNVSAYDTRRLDVGVGIGYGSDIQQAYDVIMGLIQGDERIFSDPAPQILVMELADSSVNLTARFWLKSGDYWGVKFDLTRAIKEALDANGIEIPFPQRVVHMVSEAGSA